MFRKQEKLLPRIGSVLPLFACAISAFFVACASPDNQKTPTIASTSHRQFQLFELSAEKVWQLNAPGGARFDASGLIINDGVLYTVNDRGAELFQVKVEDKSASLQPTGVFDENVMRDIRADLGASRLDVEGIALDADGTIYICEESSRSVFSWNKKTRTPKILNLDLEAAAQLFSQDPNASFEGIAIGNGKMYLANERNRAAVIVIDLASGKVLEHFSIQSRGFAFGGPHYSDLSWFEGRLFILDRNFRCILEVDPENHALVAQYNFAEMEQAPDVVYQTQFPTGTMEGLAVTRDYFYLVTDNNGLPRRGAKEDIRPTLFRIRRPSTVAN